jgi:hypothetical protein
MKIEGTKGLFIDMHPSWAPPVVDGFIVSIGQAGTVGTVYHIAHVRRVVPRVVRKGVRYQLRVYRADDLKPEVHYNPHSRRVWVRDQEAIAITWYPRKKKKP